MEENTKPTKSDLAGAEKGTCCACQKTPEEKEREKDDRVFFKIFENFLHNAIFLPRYSKPQIVVELEYQPHSDLVKLFTAPVLCLLSFCGDGHQKPEVVCLAGSKWGMRWRPRNGSSVELTGSKHRGVDGPDGGWAGTLGSALLSGGAYEETCWVGSKAFLALLWLYVALATVPRGMLGPSRQQFRQHKQTQERDVIKESEGPSLAAHS